MYTVKEKDIDVILSKSQIKIETKFDKVTIVTVKLPNGFCLTESSGAVDKRNYSEQIGSECCLERIKNKLWELEGYSLANDIYKDKLRRREGIL